jgi:hypothetical protein
VSQSPAAVLYNGHSTWRYSAQLLYGSGGVGAPSQPSLYPPYPDAGSQTSGRSLSASDTVVSVVAPG